MNISRRLRQIVAASAYLLLLMSCESELMVSSPGKPVSAIMALDKISVKPGDEVIVSGRNLTSSITVDVGGVPAELKLSDKKNGSFVLPEQAASGLLQVIFRKGDIRLATFPLLNGDNLENVPISAVPLGSVCDSYIVNDKNGDLQRGEAKCGDQIPVCTVDGETNCIATEDVPGAVKADLAAKILTGQTVAGVSGSAALRPLDCAADGDGACVVDGTLYKAAKLTNFAATDIRTGVSVAGILGTLSGAPVACSADGQMSCLANASFIAANVSGAAAKVLTGQTLGGIAGTGAGRPSDCAVDGEVNCVAISNFPAVNKVTNLAVGNLAKISSSVTVGGVVGTLANCSVDGTTACLTVTGFPSANTTGAAAKILTGQTLAGVSGSATPAPSNCAADGATDCVAVTNFPAVDRITNLAVGNLAKISSSVTVGGTVGTMGDCSSDGQTGCFAVATYPALQKSLLTASVLKNGTVINGVTGAYPNATYPLAGSTVAADLTAATFNAQVKSATAFEYFDSTGALQSGSGDDDITAANILTPVSIFGTTGTAAAIVAPDAWNVRVGTVINGVTGQLKTSCRNRANTSIWNTSVPYTASALDATANTLTISSHPFTSNMTVRVGASTEPTGITANTTTYYVIVVDANTIQLSASSGPGAQVDFTTVGSNVTVYQWSDATLHWWDTIDDENNNAVYPTSLVSGWSTDTDCDSSTWQDLTTDGTCNTAADDCIMKDRITGLMWSESYPVTATAAASTTRNWQLSIQQCNNLSFGGYSGWRLPTQKELMEAYVHGIRDVGYNGTGTIRGSGSTNNNDLFIPDVDRAFWTSSTGSVSLSSWYITLDDGYVDREPQTSAMRFICVR